MIRRLIYRIVSFPVFIYLYAYTAVIVFLTLIFAYLKWKRAICLLLSFWAKTVFPLMGKRLHIEGKNTFDRKQKYILLANHASMFDIIAIMAFYPEVSWFGHERLLKIPLVKQMLLMTEYIPMKISNISNTKKMLISLEEKAQEQYGCHLSRGYQNPGWKVKFLLSGLYPRAKSYRARHPSRNPQRLLQTETQKQVLY